VLSTCAENWRVRESRAFSQVELCDQFATHCYCLSQILIRQSSGCLDKESSIPSMLCYWWGSNQPKLTKWCWDNWTTFRLSSSQFEADSICLFEHMWEDCPSVYKRSCSTIAAYLVFVASCISSTETRFPRESKRSKWINGLKWCDAYRERKESQLTSLVTSQLVKCNSIISLHCIA